MPKQHTDIPVGSGTNWTHTVADGKVQFLLALWMHEDTRWWCAHPATLLTTVQMRRSTARRGGTHATVQARARNGSMAWDTGRAPGGGMARSDREPPCSAPARAGSAMWARYQIVAGRWWVLPSLCIGGDAVSSFLIRDSRDCGSPVLPERQEDATEQGSFTFRNYKISTTLERPNL
jgi:hypothetical protein